MLRFYDPFFEEILSLKMHPVIKMHLRQKGWTDIAAVAAMCGEYIDDFCWACSIDALHTDDSIQLKTFSIWVKLGLSTDDIMRIVNYKPPKLTLVHVLRVGS